MDTPSVALIAQGDEILAGRTADTNSPWLARRLAEHGLGVRRIVVLGDRLDELQAGIARALQAHDLLICTGGLGPTSDDLTALAVARATGRPLQHSARAMGSIRDFLSARGREPAPADAKQALLPAGAACLPNPWGTAPGFRVRHAGCTAWFLPGVPREMRSFWEHVVSPELRRRHAIQPPRITTLRCLGITEAAIQDRLASIELPPGLTLHHRALAPENRLLVRASPQVPEPVLRQVVERIAGILGEACFSVDGGPIEQVAGRLLADRGLTLSIAESCTGGALAAKVVSVPGASRYLLEAAVLYSDRAKIRTCGVPQGLLAERGAVSRPVALAMAAGMRRRTGSSHALATTGIAGPGGASPDKPVGTVHVALDTARGSWHRRLQLHGDRSRNIAYTVAFALDMLRRQLRAQLPPPTRTDPGSTPR